MTTTEPAASPTPQPEATAESESAPTEAPSPTATPLPTPMSGLTATPRPTAKPKPTATPVPTSLRQMSIQESVSPVNCDDQWLVDGIVQLSKENEDSSATRILKLYSDKVEEIERTDKLLRCRTDAKVSSGQDRNVTYYIEIDRDGDAFHGYEIGSVPSTSTPTPTLRPTPTPNAEPSTPGVGDTVKLGDFELTLQRVRGSVGEGDTVPESGNYFLLIDAVIRNVGYQTQEVGTRIYGVVQDAENGIYSSIYLQDFDPWYRPTGFPAYTISIWVEPGQTISAIAHYELPINAKGLKWAITEYDFTFWAGKGPVEMIFDLGSVAIE